MEREHRFRVLSERQKILGVEPVAISLTPTQRRLLTCKNVIIRFKHANAKTIQLLVVA